MPSHAAGNGGGHARVIEVELGLIHRGDGGVARGRGNIHLGNAFVIGLLRGVIVLAELGGAFELGLGKIELCLRLCLLRLGGFERELEGPRLDDKQKVALLDELAVDEIDGFEIAAHPRADLDRLARLELAGEIAPLLHVPDEGFGDGDGGRRGRCCRGLLALPEAPIVIEKRCRRCHDEEQEHTHDPSAGAPGGSFSGRRRVGLARGSVWSFQVRSRLLGFARGRVVLDSLGISVATVAVPVSLLHGGRMLSFTLLTICCAKAVRKGLWLRRYSKAAREREGQSPDRNTRSWWERPQKIAISVPITAICA